MKMNWFMLGALRRSAGPARGPRQLSGDGINTNNGRYAQRIDGTSRAKLGDFIKEIKGKIDKDNWTLPNVIGHDFVNEQTCKQIIELNPYYGN